MRVGVTIWFAAKSFVHIGGGTTVVLNDSVTQEK